jgi:hypothetical protein
MEAGRSVLPAAFVLYIHQLSPAETPPHGGFALFSASFGTLFFLYLRCRR